MSPYGKQCRFFLTICAFMLAAGLALPLAFGLAAPDLTVSPFVWNFLQFGGLIGTLTFWLMGKFAKPVQVEPSAT